MKMRKTLFGLPGKVLLMFCAVGAWFIYLNTPIEHKSTELLQKRRKDSGISGDVLDTTTSYSRPFKIQDHLKIITAMEDVMAIRRENIQKSCRNISETSSRNPVKTIKSYNKFIGEKHQFVYCSVPKTGFWFWTRTLQIIENEKNFSSLYEFRNSGSQLPPLQPFKRFLNTHGSSDINQFLAKAVKFMFVREPYRRLLSAYVNKIFSPNNFFWNGLGRKVVSSVRDNPSEESLKYAYDVTFAEVIKFVLLQNDRGENIDPHFAPMNEACDPCELEYDYHGTWESFSEDSHFIIAKLKEKNRNVYIDFGDIFVKETALDSAQGHTNFLYKVLSATKNLEYPTCNFFLRVWRGLQIRGHLSKHIDMPTGREKSCNFTHSEFFSQIKSALELPKNHTEVLLQRDEALKQAYSTLPLEDLERLTKFVEKDCLLFGYDTRPREIFERSDSNQEISFNYFDSL